jgi:hypothetical protein
MIWLKELPSDIFVVAIGCGESLIPEEIYERYFGEGKIG